MNNINLKVAGTEFSDEYSEKEFQDEFVSKGYVILEDDRLQDFITDVNKMIAKGNVSGLSTEQLDSIEKAKKDLTKLVRKIVVDKNGKKTTKWVKMEEHGDSKYDTKEKRNEAGMGGIMDRLKNGTSDSTNEPHKDDSNNKFLDEDNKKHDDFKKKIGAQHTEAWERHQHNMKVQRQGKEASLKHIESKYGADVAKHVRDKHEAPLKAAEAKTMKDHMAESDAGEAEREKNQSDFKNKPVAIYPEPTKAELMKPIAGKVDGSSIKSPFFVESTPALIYQKLNVAGIKGNHLLPPPIVGISNDGRMWEMFKHTEKDGKTGWMIHDAGRKVKPDYIDKYYHDEPKKEVKKEEKPKEPARSENISKLRKDLRQMEGSASLFRNAAKQTQNDKDNTKFYEDKVAEIRKKIDEYESTYVLHPDEKKALMALHAGGKISEHKQANSRPVYDKNGDFVVYLSQKRIDSMNESGHLKIREITDKGKSAIK